MSLCYGDKAFFVYSIPVPLTFFQAIAEAKCGCGAYGAIVCFLCITHQSQTAELAWHDGQTADLGTILSARTWCLPPHQSARESYCYRPTDRPLKDSNNTDTGPDRQKLSQTDKCMEIDGNKRVNVGITTT